MIKMLVASKNLNFIKNINNSLDDEKLAISNISSNYREIISYITSYKVDVILLEFDLNLKKIFNIINLYYTYYKCELTIIIYSNIDFFQNKLNNNLFIVKKERNDESLIKYLNSLINEKSNNTIDETELEKRILREMLNLGFEMKNKGDLLLLEVIKYIKINGKNKNNLKSEIYPAIANKLNIPISKIKWNIIYSIKRTYLYKSDIMERYLKEKLNNKATPKYIIYKILENIKE